MEPVYRELADLLLHDQSTPEELEQARDVIENLQLAELENFFRSACIDSQPARIDSVDSQAAVVYPHYIKRPVGGCDLNSGRRVKSSVYRDFSR